MSMKASDWDRQFAWEYIYKLEHFIHNYLYAHFGPDTEQHKTTVIYLFTYKR